MSMDFSFGAGSGSSTDLIPNGQLAWAILTMREVKVGNDSGARYLDCEFTIDEGQPFERRKVWSNIMDPMDQNQSQGGREMGVAAITRILEAGRFGANMGFDQNNFTAQGGYQLADYSQLNGMRVAIKVGVEKGTQGYSDKNKIAEFLSPNPNSASYKAFERLCRGEYNAAPAAKAPALAPAQGSFGSFGAPAQNAGAVAGGFAQAAAPVAAAGGFGAPPVAAAAPVGGFGQPAGVAAAQPGFIQPQAQGNGFAAPAAGQTTTPTTQPASAATGSPSNGAPGWLAQAQ